MQQILAVGNKHELRVICSIDSVKGGVIDAWVINGAWHLRIDKDGTATCVDHPAGPTVIPDYNILGIYTVPPHVRGDYNAIMAWLEVEMQKSFIRRWFNKRTSKLQIGYDRFVIALRLGIKAFKKSWRQEPPEDDDIPF